MPTDDAKTENSRDQSNSSRAKPSPERIAEQQQRLEEYLQTIENTNTRNSYQELLSNLIERIDFLSPNKTVEQVIHCLRTNSRRALKDTTLKLYLRFVRYFLEWWSGWDKDYRIARGEKRILQHTEAGNTREDFIIALQVRQNKIKDSKQDPTIRYDLEEIEHNLEILAKLNLPSHYRMLIRLGQITGRRLFSLCCLDFEHIKELDNGNLALIFFEKGGNQTTFKLTSPESAIIRNWLTYRDQEQKNLSEEMIDVNPLTKEKGHYLLFNNWHNRLKPEHTTTYFWQLRMIDKDHHRPICPNCKGNFLTETEVKNQICSKCRESFLKPTFLTFHFHSLRARVAIKKILEGWSLIRIARTYGWEDTEALKNHYAALKKSQAMDLRIEESTKNKSCPQCRRPIESEWLLCPFCGADLS